jgi:hypothetical protein
MVPTLSGVDICHYSLACVWALHFKLIVKFVSSLLESIKLQMPLMEMSMTYCHGLFVNSSLGQP